MRALRHQGDVAYGLIGPIRTPVRWVRLLSDGGLRLVTDRFAASLVGGGSAALVDRDAAEAECRTIYRACGSAVVRPDGSAIGIARDPAWAVEAASRLTSCVCEGDSEEEALACLQRSDAHIIAH